MKYKYAIDYTKITRFNPAIIYGFAPETYKCAEDGFLNIEDNLFPKIGQHQDMFLAYSFAQDHILPRIEQNGIASISPAQLISWIKEVHGAIAKTLLREKITEFSPNGFESGQYTNDIIIHYNHGGDIQGYIAYFLSKRAGFETPQKAARLLTKDMKGINLVEAIGFYQVLDRVATLEDSILFGSHKRSLFELQSQGRPQGLYVVKVIYKLLAAYHTGQLSAKEKANVEIFLKIAAPLERLEEELQTFVEKTLHAWKTCDAHDLDQVADLLITSSDAFTRIHPFVNGNKRTISLFNQVMLVSLGLPSTLFKQPNADDSSDLAFESAIDAFEQGKKGGLQCLRDFLKGRIQDEIRQPFSHPRYQEMTMLRCQLADILSSLTEILPLKRVNHLYKSFQDTIMDHYEEGLATHDRVSGAIFCLKKIAQSLQQQLEAYQKQRQEALLKHSVVGNTLSEEDKKAILAKFQVLSQISGWKIHYDAAKNLTKVWFDFDWGQDEQARQLGSQLKKSGVEKAMILIQEEKKKVSLVCHLTDVKAFLSGSLSQPELQHSEAASLEKKVFVG